jgi:hypothetical protein
VLILSMSDSEIYDEVYEYIYRKMRKGISKQNEGYGLKVRSTRAATLKQRKAVESIKVLRLAMMES